MKQLTSSRAASLLMGGAAVVFGARGETLTAYSHTRLIFQQLGRVMSGEIDRLMIFMPPRHGKSSMVTAAIATWLWYEPSLEMGMATFSQNLSSDLSLLVRGGYRALDGNIGVIDTVNRWKTAEGGGLWAVGVGGTAQGRGGDCLVLDDAQKQDDVHSDLKRERAWDWYRGVFRNRLHPGGKMILIGTRFHEDDIFGRILEIERESDSPERWTVLLIDMEYEPETLRELREEIPSVEVVGLDEREEGERLTMYSDDEISRTKSSSGSWVWSSVYQQRPTPHGGLMLKTEWFQYLPGLPGRITRRVRAWDLAGSTKGTADRTAGVLLAEFLNDYGGTQWIVLDIQAGRWSPKERRERIMAAANEDGAEIVIEQEYGRAGEDITGQLIADCAPHVATAIKPTGAKPVRAQGISAQAEAKNIFLLSGAPWVTKFLDEVKLFPVGTHDDRVDALAHAFNWIAANQPDAPWEVMESPVAGLIS